MIRDQPDPTPTLLSVSTRRVLEREWGLFADWCTSWGVASLPATADTVRRFLQELPAAMSTQALRVRAIRHWHLDAGVPLDLPGLHREPRTLWAVAGDLLTVSEAVAQLPRYRFPVGLKGRRDAFVLLLASLGMTRARIHGFVPAEITLTCAGIMVGGVALDWSARPGQCPRCVVVRWLQVLGPAWAGDRGQVRDVLDVTRASPDVHDCDTPVASGWERAERVVVSLDTHGWVRPGVGLSTRTISALVTPHRHPTGNTEIVPTRRASPAGVKVSADDLYEDQDDLDQRIAAALLLSAEALDRATRIRDDLAGLTGPAQTEA